MVDVMKLLELNRIYFMKKILLQLFIAIAVLTCLWLLIMHAMVLSEERQAQYDSFKQLPVEEQIRINCSEFGRSANHCIRITFQENDLENYEHYLIHSDE